jgi:hypothetical protein
MARIFYRRIKKSTDRSKDKGRKGLIKKIAKSKTDSTRYYELL